MSNLKVLFLTFILKLTLVLGVTLVFKSTPAMAESICYDMDKFSTEKEKFPDFLQELPVIYSMNSIFAHGAIQLLMDDGKLKTAFNIRAGLSGKYIDESYVKKICKEGNEYSFFLEKDNVEIKIKQKGNKLSLKGQDLKKSSGKDLEQVLTEVIESRKQKSAPQISPSIGGAN